MYAYIYSYIREQLINDSSMNICLFLKKKNAIAFLFMNPIVIQIFLNAHQKNCDRQRLISL